MDSFKGKKVTIGYDAKVCIHAGKCVARLPAVFDLSRDPWIDPDRSDPDTIETTVKACPSGALRFERKDEDTL